MHVKGLRSGRCGGGLKGAADVLPVYVHVRAGSSAYARRVPVIGIAQVDDATGGGRARGSATTSHLRPRRP